MSTAVPEPSRNRIEAGAVTADSIVAHQVTYASIRTNTITAATLRAAAVTINRVVGGDI